MTDLITRLEQAGGPDRVLDARIWCEINGLIFGHYHNYTSSIDAALTLVPDGWLTTIDIPGLVAGSEAECNLHRPNDDGTSLIFADGKTPAIAICIAALRAIEHEKSNG